MKLLKILLVCTGNTCRSPLAEALLKHELNDKELGYELQVSSAGLAVYAGERISEKVVMLLHEEQIEHDAQRNAIQLDQALIQDADLILTMTADQLQQVMLRFPESSSRVYLLTGYSGLSPADIKDPYGGSPEKYRQTMEEIRLALKNLITKLEEG
ncbi:MAG: low molecular weight protein arginine phosphatase [Firmicutes bacterium]|nr:low molecular weight protein arginine phosphatase [Bacillota bacterium]